MSDEEIKERPDKEPIRKPFDIPDEIPDQDPSEDKDARDHVESDDAAQPPSTNRSRFRGYALASAMAAVGILFSTILILTRPVHSPPDPEHMNQHEIEEELETEWLGQDAGTPPPGAHFAGHPDTVFARLSDRIHGAPSPERKVKAVLEMVSFLLDTPYWRSERVRHIMAREYLLTLADAPLEIEDPPWPVAEQFLRTAAIMQDRPLYSAAMTMLPEDTPRATLPFSLLLAEADALLALHEYGTVYKRLDELSAHAAPDQSMYQSRMARALRAALDNPKALEALRHYRNIPETDTLSSDILAELDALAAALSALPDIEIGAEGLMLRAYIANRHGDTEQEIGALQRVIARGASTFRPQAYTQLLERLGEEERHEEHAALLTGMIIRPELRDRAIAELHARLQAPAEAPVLRDLLQAARYHADMYSPQDPPQSALLVAAARAALQQGWTEQAEEYVEMAEKHTADRRIHADATLLRAGLAELSGDTPRMIYYLSETLTLFPSHPEEANIRFKLLDSLADFPFSEADLVSTIMGAVARIPRDRRGLEGLLLVAQRLENLHLYDQAKVYYQRVVLFSSLQGLRETSAEVSVALLGQARCMMALQQDAEADALLRVINTNPRWADIWYESGPLWATIAFRNRQPREAVRRWRHTCGPPGGSLLPFLFHVLVPDLAEWPQTVVISAKPRKPPFVSGTLMDAAVNAALDHLLQQNDYEQLDRLLTLIKNDEEWKQQLPLNTYRTRCLQHLVARERSTRILEWLERHPVSVTDEQQEVRVDTARLKQLIGEVESAGLRARSVSAL